MGDIADAMIEGMGFGGTRGSYHPYMTPRWMPRVCPWAGCKQPVFRRAFLCAKHGEILPQELRDRIYATYPKKGGEPSLKYIEASKAAQEWIQNALKEERKKTVPAGSGA